MKVTVIIPTMFKNRDYLTLCVESLLATTDWDIIVSENGAPFESEFDCSDTKRVGYMHDPRQGQCMAVNVAAAVVPKDTDYIFISNDDMYYAPGWLNEMQFAEEWPLVWSPNLVEPTDNPGSAPPFLKLDAGFTLDNFDRAKVDEFVKLHEDNKEEPGFNFPLFIRKDFWDEIGGYDERYDPWGSNSDSDIQCRAAIAGVQSMRLRDVLVYHFSNKSGTFDGSHQQEWQDNWNYFIEKYGFERAGKSEDVWYSQNLVDWDKLIFKPEWMNKYGN